MTTFPNWFETTAQRQFEKHLAPFAGRPGLRFLQLGAFCGHASAWLLKNILTAPDALLTDVDPWVGSEDIHDIDFAAVEREHAKNTAPYSSKLRKCKMSSLDFFLSEPATETYDFIYVDGDHTAFAVLNDAIESHRRLKLGGILAFDDYIWTFGAGPLHDPKTAIDAFESVYADKFELFARTTQVWLRKIA